MTINVIINWLQVNVKTVLLYRRVIIYYNDDKTIIAIIKNIVRQFTTIYLKKKKSDNVQSRKTKKEKKSLKTRSGVYPAFTKKKFNEQPYKYLNDVSSCKFNTIDIHVKTTTKRTLLEAIHMINGQSGKR